MPGTPPYFVPPACWHHKDSHVRGKSDKLTMWEKHHFVQQASYALGKSVKKEPGFHILLLFNTFTHCEGALL